MTATSLSQLLRDRLQIHAAANRIALLDDHRVVSYADLIGRIDGRAAAARSRVARGERVGLLGPKSPEALSLFFGIMQAGGCPAFLDPRLGSDALSRHARAIGIRQVFVPDDTGSLTEAPGGAELLVQSLGLDSPSNEEDSALRTLTRSDLAMLQSTSGSTGVARGVLLSHGNLLANADGVIRHTGITPSDRLLHVMPLHHTNGLNNQVIAPLLAGASVVLIDRFRADQFETEIARWTPTYLTGVPTMYARVLPHLCDSEKRRSLRFLRCGSAPLTPTLQTRIEEEFGVPLIVSYGLSEATCTSTMNPPSARRVGSVGTVLRGQQVRICAPGTTDAVASGTEGEICIAGPTVMQGYSDGSAAPTTLDGWLPSGDLGHFDADGYLFVTGRLKDLIIRGGENLSPRRIEQVLLEDPTVAECCVVGAPDSDLGEQPVVFARAKDGADLQLRKLRALVTRRLSRIHAPCRLYLLDALPETSIGKIDRAALRRRAAGLTDETEDGDAQ
ncbi:MAG: class I adenylate-forming enzyme family protein [Acidobacteriota bacterium]|nr:class I adenylate-forming enzyme family protein [Acidobacteriota bacterium]